MSILSKIKENNNIVKISIAVIAAIVIIVGVYAFLDNDSDDKKDTSLENLTIDRDMDIDSVEDVEKVIAYWIDNNPEAIIQSVTKMQQKAVQKQMQDAQKNISKKKDEIFSSSAPSYSPAGYTATIVEFYDYNCGYCKQANKSVQELLKKDKKVRVIYRDFPILGQLSKEISQVSIAAHMVAPKKFRGLHEKLMSSKISNQNDAIKAAGQVGISTAQIRAVLKNKKDDIDSILQDNLILGSTVGISGTPAFIIGEELLPGAVDAATLKAKIDATR